LLVVSEASERGSFAMTIAANVTRFGFSDLRAAPRVLGAPNWIVPGADMEATFFPQAHDIVDIVTGEFYPAQKTNRRGVRNWDDRDLSRRAL
jgi:2-oxoisovalerate dehydrogenase E1 component